MELHARHGATLPTVQSTMHLYPIDGAAHRPGRTDTAFSYRDATWAMVIAGVDHDPAKAAEALITAVGSENPPYMLLLGNDASDGFRTALDALRTEVDEWEGLSRSTDFDA